MGALPVASTSAGQGATCHLPSFPPYLWPWVSNPHPRRAHRAGEDVLEVAPLEEEELWVIAGDWPEVRAPGAAGVLLLPPSRAAQAARVAEVFGGLPVGLGKRGGDPPDVVAVEGPVAEPGDAAMS